MAKKNSYYMPFDEDFLQDPDIQMFLELKGKEAVFDYLMLLLRMRDYKDYGYMIPTFLVPIIAKKDLGEPKEKLEDTIQYCLDTGLFKKYQDDVATYFYSSRRKKDLEDWDVKSTRRSEAGKKGMKSRYNKEGETKDED